MKKYLLIILLTLFLCVPNWQLVSAARNDPLLPSADIILDVGHGGIDSGTMVGKYEEKDMNLAIAKKTYKALVKRGYRVIINRTEDYALSDDNRWSFGGRHRKDLAQRSGLANTIKPKIMLSLHINWSKKSNTRGPLVIYQNQSDSILLASLLQDTLNNVYGMEELPVLGKKYFVLRFTKCPSVIVELGFLSNKTDRKLLNDSHHQAKLAKAITHAVDQYFSMTQPKS
ncbi:N-acetylmuramoyl-L-alanine amidase LytC [Paenibacillus allorhizoplanae]|uniref:N-acetylmuramoyl-L-alanine amidase LytC n=1 Tax=Paenibacillus allorhizoplanae TaxID=2905648 RepID=A0ABM9CIG7_9BACL|nr:N-acetylmuramoyl-L-alanine amidase [Paenibacillus allorhizoplanae]CAH1215050.1 N-acetylmuramoyl-L-alanine amidase LytC [Paenibacillus allorhizoplanae]